MATEHTDGNVSKHPPAEVNEWRDFSQEPHRTAELSTEKSVSPVVARSCHEEIATQLREDQGWLSP